MIRFARAMPLQTFTRRSGAALMLALAALALAPAAAIDTKVTGRITFGSAYRLQAADPALLTPLNADVVGLAGTGSGGNVDDADTNFRRHDAVTTALRGYLDFAATQGNFSALGRVKAWYDYALRHQGRAWGNVPNGYAAGEPLSDQGAARLSRFSGVALGEFYVQQRFEVGGMRLLGRVGQQSLGWGERSGVGGGLEILDPKDLPALRRAAALPIETKVPVAGLFGRLELGPALAFEGFFQPRFRPTALDQCGTFWSFSDYLAQGCDKVMSGAPAINDRERVASGSYMKRLDVEAPTANQYGLAMFWKSAPLATEFGLYHARYTARTPMPGLRKSTRRGAALIPRDPDGRNMRFLAEYPDRLKLSALTFNHKRGASSVFGEVSYRPNQPFMLAPGDVIPPFLNPSVASLLRADADAVAPGGIFHGYDSLAVAQAQIGVQRDWSPAGVALSTSAEVVGKHTYDLPDQALRRYGRADLFGQGPVLGRCTVTSANPARQCTLRGYASTNAYAYRLRIDARLPALAAALDSTLSAIFAHDVKGWSGDFLINEGRKSLNLALRFEYRQRYLGEIVYLPIWGGDYNVGVDRDTLALAVGVRF